MAPRERLNNEEVKTISIETVSDRKTTTLYDKLFSRLKIDPLEIDYEFIDLPQIITEAGEQTARAQARMEDAKHTVDRAKAQALLDVRDSYGEGRKPTDKLVEAEATVSASLQNANDDFVDARANYMRWKSLHDGLTNKSQLLKSYSQLLISGFITPNSLTVNRRAEMNSQRRDVRRITDA